MKTCKTCTVAKLVDEFARHSTNLDRRQGSCKACNKEKRSTQRDGGLPSGDPRHGYNGYLNFRCKCLICYDGLFLAQIKKNHNVTADWFAQQLLAQGFGCAVCATRGVTLYIDHDHKCCPTPGKSCGKCARGLLCSHCNLGLGHFRDKSQTLNSALDYLAHHG